MEYWVYLGLPVLGYFIGSFKATRIVKTTWSSIVFCVTLSFIIFYLISGVSFRFVSLDILIVVLFLLVFGYSSAGIKLHESKKVKLIIRSFQLLLFLSYFVTPLLYYILLIIAFGGSSIEFTQNEEQYSTYKIEHLKVNSNFTFPGYHLVKVYKKKYLFEYPVDEYNLGQYGGFLESTTVFDASTGAFIPAVKYEYDLSEGDLYVLRYKEGEYRRGKPVISNLK